MERQELLRNIQAYNFAAYDLLLYLDTHPRDAQAISAGSEYARRAAALRAEYEKRFGSLTGCFDESDSNWKWVCDPWPWDNFAG